MSNRARWFAPAITPPTPWKVELPPSVLRSYQQNAMLKFLLWCLLLVVCWPVALLALVLYPIVWVLLIPFRIVGIAVSGVLELLSSLITFPARLIRRMA